MVVNLKRWVGSDAVEIAVRIIVFITVVVCFILFNRQNTLADCQASYNQTYAEYAKIARANADDRNMVQYNLFRAISDARDRNNASTQRDIDVAFVKYFTTIELADKQKAENPPPALPEAFCD